MAATPDYRLTPSPYPGLRPFQPHEVDIFFGREKQTVDLLRRLKKSRFLAVLGPSGCGKSSLVRAGMVASLEAGFLTSAGCRWRVAEMRPGEEPMERLARALLSPQALAAGDEPEAAPFMLATLRRGPRGVVKALRERPLPQGANLLILVDQFEEIFRFRREGDADEADAFVKLLLAAAAEPDIPVYVVITMRSDFLGDCGLFKGLPEMMSDHQFLTPRLEREQCQAAIEKPARVFGGEVEPQLVSRLLNDMGLEPDQLPLLQHALMRMWLAVAARPPADGGDGGGDGAGGTRLITLRDYECVGGAAALSKHAQEVYDGLGLRKKRIAEVMFRRMTERAAGKRDTRRPARLKDVAEVAGVAPAAVMDVVEEFRKPDRSFVTPPAGISLKEETMLDIGHESLIRQWTQLNEWVNEEEQSAASYQRLKQWALLWVDGNANLWDGVNLQRTLAWRETQKPTASWDSRYGTPEEFALAMRFLDASDEYYRAEQEAERQNEMNRLRLDEESKVAGKLRALVAALAALALFLGASVVWAVGQRKAAEAAQFEKAELEISQARRLQQIAEGNLAAMQRLQGTADSAARKAFEEGQRAQASERLARESEAKARAQLSETERQKGLALAAAGEVRKLAELSRIKQSQARAELDKIKADARAELAKIEQSRDDAFSQLLQANSVTKELQKEVADVQKQFEAKKLDLARVTQDAEEAERKLAEARKDAEVLERQVQLARQEKETLEAERRSYLSAQSELRVRASYFDSLRSAFNYTSRTLTAVTPVFSPRGKLRLKLSDVYGQPLGEKVDVALENQLVPSLSASRKRQDASADIAFDSIAAAPFGAYRVTVGSDSFLQVTKFINVKPGDWTEVPLTVPFDSNKVEAVFPRFGELPAESRALLEASTVPHDSRLKSGEALYKDLEDDEKACLLNAVAKAQAARLGGGESVLSHVRALAELRANGFFARVDGLLPYAVKSSRSFKEVSGALHPPSPLFADYDLVGSFKSQAGLVRLSLTFYAKGEDVVADVELEGVELNYAFQALKSNATTRTAHPFDINQLLAYDQVPLLYRLKP